jgi:hypothetical protein
VPINSPPALRTPLRSGRAPAPVAAPERRNTSAMPPRGASGAPSSRQIHSAAAAAAACEPPAPRPPAATGLCRRCWQALRSSCCC